MLAMRRALVDTALPNDRFNGTISISYTILWRGAVELARLLQFHSCRVS